jgi:SAM-dependent methyltransferase
MPMRCRVDSAGDVDLRADFHDLPVASHSADLVLLPHTLEFTDSPHQILREVARVLLPEGHVIIAGFNPWSLWGARRAFGSRRRYPWNGRFINLPRMKDWLALLGLEIAGGQMGCYIPPCATQRWLDRLGFMEAAGDRWWPIAGGVYFLQAVKRVHGMRVIMQKWSDRLVPAKSLAAAPKKVRQPEDVLVARDMRTEA